MLLYIINKSLLSTLRYEGFVTEKPHINKEGRVTKFLLVVTLVD